jgi:hypothetical protein
VSVSVTRSGLGCAAAVLVLAGSVSAAGSATGFGAPRTIGTRPYPGGEVATAIDPAGDWIVAWAGAAGLEVSRDAGPPELLSHGSPPSAFALSMAPDGSAAIAWVQSVTQPLGVATAPAGGRFGAPQTSRATDVLATNGRVVAIWDRGVTRGHGRIYYAIAPEGGRLGAPTALPAPSSALLPQLIARPALAADQRGDVFLDYLTAPRSSPPLNTQLAGAVMTAGASSFGSPSIVSGAPDHGSGVEQSSSYSYPSSLVSGPGGVAATFVSATPTAWQMAAANATSTGFAPPATAGTVMIPTRPGETMTLVGPAAALPARGGELVAWSATPTAAESGPPPSNGAVYASVAPFAARHTLAAPDRQWPRDLLAAATSDRSIVLWTTLAGAPSYDRETLEYALHGPEGFTPAHTLASNPLEPATFAPDPVALAAAGEHAIVAWGAGRRVQIAQLNG